MTAEIAILNRSAVALAADSFVTVSSGGEKSKSKTYLVNKLFTLSKYQPVGIMIYGSAGLLGVPWETIVKVYRNQLGTKSFDTIDDYCKDLISWLGSDSVLFTEKEQRYHLYAEVERYYESAILLPIGEQVQAWIRRNRKEIGRRQVNKIANDTIGKHFRALSNEKLLPYLPADFEQRLSKEYFKEIERARERVFSAFTLREASKQQLASIAVNYVAREVGTTAGVSGVVIAGFGDKEKYPAVRAFKTHTVVCGKLLYDMDDDNSANLNSLNPGAISAAICPFAQRDVVDGFLQGIEPHFLKIVVNYFSRVMRQLPGIVSNSLPRVRAADKKTLTKNLQKAGEEIIADFASELSSHVRAKHWLPMLETVSILPKEELAAMADSLVSLTSAKRKMSLDLETVGGPVDVAVVTKGDGFVWINRKHYFQSELNPHFLANYFDRKL